MRATQTLAEVATGRNEFGCIVNSRRRAHFDACTRIGPAVALTLVSKATKYLDAFDICAWS
jgi:hypothetical protein